MVECFICLESKNLFKRTQCCKKYVHKSCQDKWMQYYKHKSILNCPYCRKEVKNHVFIPIELHNLPYTFYNYDDTTFKDKIIIDYDTDDDDAFE